MNSNVLKVFLTLFFLILTVGILTRKSSLPEEKSVTPSPTRANIPSPTRSFSFDLKGPTVCTMREKEASMSAYIKNERMFFEKEGEDYFLFRDDCLYIWKRGEYSGEKICGLSQYLSIVKQFSQFGFFSINDILGFVNQFVQESQFGEYKKYAWTFLDACRRKEIPEEKVFEIPKKVLFKNKQLQK